MTGFRDMLKASARAMAYPLRVPLIWAVRSGLVSQSVRKYLPSRWSLKPFTISGPGWKCKWFPTEFDAIGHEVLWSGLTKWEKETVPVMLDNIRNARCFIDVGSNTGIYTVLACTINSGVRVIAVEPAPKVCAALKKNIAGNNLDSRVTVLNIALADSNGTVSFHEAEDSTMSSLDVEGYQGQPGKVTQVECRTLDSVVEQLKLEPDFLKIDVEGFEHAVLSGADRLLSVFRPRIVIESNPGDPSDCVTEILLKHGYGFQHITDNGLESRDRIVPAADYRNWLCVPR
jgi:FkbM family methyltransferase